MCTRKLKSDCAAQVFLIFVDREGIFDSQESEWKEMEMKKRLKNWVFLGVEEGVPLRWSERGESVNISHKRQTDSDPYSLYYNYTAHS